MGINEALPGDLTLAERLGHGSRVFGILFFSFGVGLYLYSNPILSNIEELPRGVFSILVIISPDISEARESLELIRGLGLVGILVGTLLFVVGAVYYQRGSGKLILNAGGWVDLVVGVIILIGAFILGYAPANSTMQDYHTVEGIAVSIASGGGIEEYAKAVEIRAVSGAVMGFGLMGILAGLQELQKGTGEGVPHSSNTKGKKSKSLAKEAQETKVLAQDKEEKAAEAYGQKNWEEAIRMYEEARREYDIAQEMFSDIEDIKKENRNYREASEYEQIKKFCEHMSDACSRMAKSAEAAREGYKKEKRNLQSESEDLIDEARQHY